MKPLCRRCAATEGALGLAANCEGHEVFAMLGSGSLLWPFTALLFLQSCRKRLPCMSVFLLHLHHENFRAKHIFQC